MSERRRNKAKYPNWNPIRFMFVKETSIPKFHSSSSWRSIKGPSTSISYNCQKIYSWSRRYEIILEDQISRGDQQAYYLQVFRRLYKHWKKTNKAPVFSNRSLTNILKYREKMKTSNILENKTPSDTYWTVHLAHVKVQAQLCSKPPLE